MDFAGHRVAKRAKNDRNASFMFLYAERRALPPGENVVVEVKLWS